MRERADHDEIAINGKLRVETIDDEVQFWSEFDGWVATVGHKTRGDGLTEAEAAEMARLWNERDRIAELERELAEARGLIAECLALNPSVTGDMEKVRVWANVVKLMRAEAGKAKEDAGDA